MSVCQGCSLLLQALVIFLEMVAFIASPQSYGYAIKTHLKWLTGLADATKSRQFQFRDPHFGGRPPLAVMSQSPFSGFNWAMFLTQSLWSCWPLDSVSVGDGSILSCTARSVYICMNYRSSVSRLVYFYFWLWKKKWKSPVAPTIAWRQNRAEREKCL